MNVAILIWQIVLGVVMIVIFLIGLSGIPGDIQTWKEWFGKMLTKLDEKGLRFLLAFIGIAGLVVIWAPPWREWLASKPSITIEKTIDKSSNTIYTIKDGSGQTVDSIVVPPTMMLELVGPENGEG